MGAVAQTSGGDRSWWRLRLEEWVLLGHLVVGIGICAAATTEAWLPFHLVDIAGSYISYFGAYMAVLVFVTLLLRDYGVPRPRSRALDNVLSSLLGRTRETSHPRLPIYDLVRGWLLLSAALSVYTNVKLRYRFLNPYNFDGLYEQWDKRLGLDAIAAEGVSWVRESPAAFAFFEKVYFHDYLFVVALITAFFLRADLDGMRIVFVGSAITYLTGIFVTTLAPSYGPCFFDVEAYSWIPSDSRTGMTQNYLATFYAQNARQFDAQGTIDTKAFQGIAAFPSLHVGHMAFVAFASGRRFLPITIAAIVSMILTTMATLAFGWHWAVDALGGIIVAWWGAALARHLVHRAPSAVPEAAADSTEARLHERDVPGTAT